MNDIHRVCFAKMKLMGSTKKYWQSVHLGELPITLWHEMKQKSKVKYLPHSIKAK